MLLSMTLSQKVLDETRSSSLLRYCRSSWAAAAALAGTTITRLSTMAATTRRPITAVGSGWAW